ncbi:MAG: NfeD family protein [Ghiorsea sp.]|nr:NfeD family protein [Ghiorsea sp.]
MIEHWHIWLIIAFVILIVEMMSGTYFLLALAGGAALTAIATWWATPDLTAQLFIFAAASAVTYMLLLSFRKKKEVENTDGTTHMIGQQVQVVETTHTQGRVKYKGVLWQAKSEDTLEKGSMAEILEVDGSTLTIKALDNT